MPLPTDAVVVVQPAHGLVVVRDPPEGVGVHVAYAEGAAHAAAVHHAREVGRGGGGPHLHRGGTDG